MTTEEFAAMIVDTLHEQNYFKKGIKGHPSDIAVSFVSTAETIASTMEWAIKKVQDINLNEKMGILRTGNLSKNVSGYLVDTPFSSEHTYTSPIDEEESLGYSEWKRDGYL
jgi:hypothetical protein